MGQRTYCPVLSPKELNFRKDVVADILSGAEHSSRKAESTRRYRNIK
jgi:hypothetical protein